MRYIIIGAGAVGGTIGARLFESGHEVVLVARGAHYAALRDGGLRFATPAGLVTLPIPVASGPGGVTLRSDDVLVLAVKTQDSVAALDAWAGQPVTGTGSPAGTAVAASVLPVVCAQNGVASESLALRRFRRVYGMCVWLPATHLEPGRVEAQAAPLSGLLPVGRYPSGADDTARAVAADLAASAFLSPVSDDVMRYKYSKLLGNLSNAVEAVCGSSRDHAPSALTPAVPATTDSSGTAAPGTTANGTAGPAAAVSGAAGPGMAALRHAARAEGEAVLAAAGIGYAGAGEIEALRGDQVRVQPVAGARRGGGSSWQSLTRGTGSIEADYLNGEIVLLGRMHGVPAPVNELLQQLANQFAAERRAPGSITPGELAALTAAA